MTQLISNKELLSQQEPHNQEPIAARDLTVNAEDVGGGLEPGSLVARRSAPHCRCTQLRPPPKQPPQRGGSRRTTSRRTRPARAPRTPPCPPPPCRIPWAAPSRSTGHRRSLRPQKSWTDLACASAARTPLQAPVSRGKEWQRREDKVERDGRMRCSRKSRI